MIDFHCHIDLYPEPRSVVSKIDKECHFVLSVTTTPSAFQVTKQIGEASDKIQTAIGLHPQLAAERKRELDLFDSILSQTRFVGEIGLDGAPEFRDSWKTQQYVFSHILQSCSSAGGKILSIHSRRASSQVIETLNGFQDCGIPILHWFSGTLNDLKKAIEIGCWFSIGPPMVQSQAGRKLISVIPKNRILTETDGPFVSLIGKPAYPWDVRLVEEALVDFWQLPLAGVKEQLALNCRKILKTPISELK